MGALSQFVCRQCGYQAEVSGGDDSGLELFTTTIVCLDCRELRDVTIGKRDQPVPAPPRCPRSKRHAIQPWLRDGPCPRCGTPMQDRGITCIWD